MALRPKFDPEAHDLDKKFRLTKYTGERMLIYFLQVTTWSHIKKLKPILFRSSWRWVQSTHGGTK